MYVSLRSEIDNEEPRKEDVAVEREIAKILATNFAESGMILVDSPGDSDWMLRVSAGVLDHTEHRSFFGHVALEASRDLLNQHHLFVSGFGWSRDKERMRDFSWSYTFAVPESQLEEHMRIASNSMLRKRGTETPGPLVTYLRGMCERTVDEMQAEAKIEAIRRELVNEMNRSRGDRVESQRKELELLLGE